MLRYITFFSVISLITGILGFSLEGELAAILRITFLIAIDLTLVLVISRFIFKQRKKRKLIKREAEAVETQEVVSTQQPVMAE